MVYLIPSWSVSSCCLGAGPALSIYLILGVGSGANIFRHLWVRCKHFRQLVGQEWRGPSGVRAVLWHSARQENGSELIRLYKFFVFSPGIVKLLECVHISVRFYVRVGEIYSFLFPQSNHLKGI